MCKDKHWEGIQDEMFENRVEYKHSCCQYLLLIYRIIAFIFLLQTIIHFEAYIGRNWYTQLAYLTIWGQILTTITFGGLLCLTSKNCRNKHCRKSCKWFVHVMYILSLSLGVMIFLVFWLALLPFLLRENFNALFYWFQVELHFFTQMFIIVDFILCDIFFHKWQYFIVLAVGVGYLVVNAVVTLTAFTVYPILTWRDVMTAVWVVVCFGLATGSFFLFWWLGRKKLRRRERKRAGENGTAMQEALIKRKDEEQRVKQSQRGSLVL